MLASNITWNAYNNFGGRSNYIHPDQLPPTPTANARMELKRYIDPDHVTYDTDTYAPLSFDRPEPFCAVGEREEPTDPIEGRQACHLAPAEWRLLAWLEREQFAYDYYAETQLHSGVLDLSRYRVLILNTHPEYWSRTMYRCVKEWVQEQGGKLMYLGGNGLDCLVDFVGDSAVIYQNGPGRVLRRSGLENRFHLKEEPTTCLLGVVYSDPGAMTAAPYQVIDPTHWAFEGTGLRKGDLFGQHSLHRRCVGGASGHETDKLTPHSPPNAQLIAQGTNANQGGADMIYYPTASGGEVFSVGSITYVASLLVDDRISQITANALRRFLG